MRWVDNNHNVSLIQQATIHSRRPKANLSAVIRQPKDCEQAVIKQPKISQQGVNGGLQQRLRKAAIARHPQCRRPLPIPVRWSQLTGHHQAVAPEGAPCSVALSP